MWANEKHSRQVFDIGTTKKKNTQALKEAPLRCAIPFAKQPNPNIGKCDYQVMDCEPFTT